MLLCDILQCLGKENISYKLETRKDRAILLMYDKSQRAATYKRLAEYLRKHTKTNGACYTRATPLEEIRGAQNAWVVGWNLSEEQFASAICTTITLEGFTINVV